jgi:uridine kinase
VSGTYEALLARLANAIATLHPDRRIRVAIDCVDGAGKTVLADALAALVIAKGRQARAFRRSFFRHSATNDTKAASAGGGWRRLG